MLAFSAPTSSLLLCAWCLLRYNDLNLAFGNNLIFRALSFFFGLLLSKFLVVLDFLSDSVCFFIEHSLLFNDVLLEEVVQTLLLVAADATHARDEQ